MKKKYGIEEIIDKVGDELFDKQSLAALIFLVDKGYELDFHDKNFSYGISWLNEDKLLLSSSNESKIQEFEDIIDLIIHSTIDGKPFLEVWDDLILDFI